MPSETASQPEQTVPIRSSYAPPLALLALGLLVRLAWAYSIFLNPDEALHYLLSIAPSLHATYEASLTTVHPPLLIVFLHYWSRLGNSEFMLRLPSVFSATAFCWIIYLWMKRFVDSAAAPLALALLLFSPSLIYLSTEVRQYSLLLLFISVTLYCLDSSVEKQSPPAMAISGLALSLALLTHYAAFIFAFVIGVYALLRFHSTRPRKSILAVWAAGQVLALVIIAILAKTQVLVNTAKGTPEILGNAYLRGSIFHPGKDRLISFLFKTTIRLFHFFFSQEVVGVIGLLLFFAALLKLVRSSPRPDSRLPALRQLAWLLSAPFVLTCAGSLTGLYPYGGSRHDSFLAMFAFPGIALSLARWRPAKLWLRSITIALVLLICNLFPAATGQYITFRNQRSSHMREAISKLQLATLPGSEIFTDDQGSLLLSYYLCHSHFSQQTIGTSQFRDTTCGNYRVISIDPHVWIFRAEAFPLELAFIRDSAGTAVVPPSITLFQAGWMVDREPQFRAVLPANGCSSPQEFGRNIFLCELSDSPPTEKPSR